MEYFDIVDMNGVPTGKTVERKTAHREGIMHRTSHVWLIRMKDSRSQILLQKRCAIKDSFPGCYDISSAGHIPAGCDFKESAVRELKEELGIDVSEDQLIYCGDRIINWDREFHGVPFRDRQFSRVFYLLCNLDEKDYVLQAEEVESVLWMDLEDCMEAVSADAINHCIVSEELEMVRRAVEASFSK